MRFMTLLAHHHSFTGSLIEDGIDPAARVKIIPVAVSGSTTTSDLEGIDPSFTLWARSSAQDIIPEHGAHWCPGSGGLYDAQSQRAADSGQGRDTLGVRSREVLERSPGASAAAANDKGTSKGRCHSTMPSNCRFMSLSSCVMSNKGTTWTKEEERRGDHEIQVHVLHVTGMANVSF